MFSQRRLFFSLFIGIFLLSIFLSFYYIKNISPTGKDLESSSFSSYKVLSSNDKLTEKGFNKLEKNSALLKEEVVVYYDKSKDDFPKRIDFLDGLDVEGLSSISVTGNAVSDISDEEILTQSRHFFNQYEPVLGIKSEDLFKRNVIKSDKFERISFQQVYEGIPVYNSNTILAKSGNKWISFNTNYLQDLNIDSVPSIEELEANKYARNYLSTSELPVESGLFIYSSDSVKPVLSYIITFPITKRESVHNLKAIDGNLSSSLTQPIIVVDADSGKIIDYIEGLRTLDVSGDIYGEVVDDHLGNPKLIRNFSDNYVYSSGNQVISNELGNYFISSGDGKVISYLEGPFVKVVNSQQDASKFESFSNSKADINWSKYDTSYKFEESNVFYHSNFIHNYFSNGNYPFNVSGLNFMMTATVNIPGTCNAFARGNSMGFYAAGGGCESLALSSDVIYHEYTHNMVFNVAPRLSEVYRGETGNMNEGYADYYACSINNNSCLSDDFFSGRGLSCLRDCDNQKRFPEDYGDEPHYAAEIISGSIWDVREELGQEIADTLAILALSFDPQTFQELADYFLIADDAHYGDGVLSNGAPHAEVICKSFYENHGIYSDYCFDMLPLFGKIDELSLFGQYANITGSAGGRNFSKYILYYGSGNFPEEWVKIVEGDEVLKEGNFLTDFDLTKFSEGDGVLKLEVYDFNNNFIVFEKKIYINNYYLISPQEFDIYKSGDSLSVNFSCLSQDCQLKFKKQEDSDWSSNAISKTFSDSSLFIWDTNGLKTGFYDLGLFVNNNLVDQVNSIYLDESLRIGWPVRINSETICYDSSSDINYLISKENGIVQKVYSNSFSLFNLDENLILLNDVEKESSQKYEILNSLRDCSNLWIGFLIPVVEDLNNDGSTEIMVTSGGNPPKLYLFSINGSLKWKQSIGSESMPGGNMGPPVVADLNNDGYKEIIVYSPGFSSSKVFVYSFDGSILFDVQVSQDLKATLTVADLNNDGYKEIIVKGLDSPDRKITILSNTGKIISEFSIEPKTMGAIGPESSIAIGNFDNDSDYELVSADPSKFAGRGNYTGAIFIYNLDGSVVSAWPVYTDGIFFSSPVVADLNNDNRQDIIVGPIYSSSGLYAFDRQGNLISGWPSLANNEFWSTPSIANVVNGSEPEILISSLGSKSYLINSSGEILDGWPIFTPWRSYSSDIITDINSDGKQEFLTTLGGINSCNSGNCGGVYGWDRNGNSLFGFPKVTEMDAQGFLSVFKEGPSSLNIIASSDWDSTLKQFKNRGSIYVWEIDTSKNNSLLSWPTYMLNNQRTGCYDCNFSEPKPVCNNNNICESENGENNLNCPNDCKGVVVDRTICVDQDGFDITTRSYSTFENVEYYDYCADNQNVNEYYCGLNVWKLRTEVKSSVKECKYGCYDGACVAQAKAESACEDDDPSDDPKVLGQVNFKGAVYIDKCEENGLSVRQYYCTEDKLRNQVKRCPNNGRCNEGVCN